MLLLLSKYSKVISGFFILAMYLQFILMPSSVKASPFRIYKKPDFIAGNDWRTNLNQVVPVINDKPVLTTTQRQEKMDIELDLSPEKMLNGGPTQPEMQAFTSVNSANMVDLFTGDFSYNIPLLDVGGYPVNIAYRAGASMDEDASWVGLGWNINPGTITRNMRGLPDEFDGKYDSITKTVSIKDNRTIGVSLSGDIEVVGLPLNLTANFGMFHNNYKGWSLEYGLNASLNSAIGSKGSLTSGLSVNNNSQDGLTLSPSLSLKLGEMDENNKGNVGTFSVSSPYNSRYGIRALNLTAGIKQNKISEKNSAEGSGMGRKFSSHIAFASPAFMPSITMPFTSTQVSYTIKGGLALKAIHPSSFISGYASIQTIEDQDKTISLPSYGYLNYQEAVGNQNALLDFNHEKDIPYREKPPVPQIALPIYTYDAFSITGEGTGGMFRAYRSDIGIVHDHYMRTRDASGAASIDFGVVDLSHGGVDLNVNRSVTQSGSWESANPLARTIGFKKSEGLFEAAYFRNPGEKAINDKNFYETLGGDDLVAVKLFQAQPNSSTISSTNYLTRYQNKTISGENLLTPATVIKNKRDKRSQLINYLTAAEAQNLGLLKYIEHYNENEFKSDSCKTTINEGVGGGLWGQYFQNKTLSGEPLITRIDPVIDITESDIPFTPDNYSIRWTGSLLAPETGTYDFSVLHDNGVRLWLNDSLLIDHWFEQLPSQHDFSINLIAGEKYKIKIEFFEGIDGSLISMRWRIPGNANLEVVPSQYLINNEPHSFNASPNYVKEKKINDFRKPNHLSEISVLNNDGRRYVYGIPVYNLKQKDVSFAVNSANSDPETGLVNYTPGIDNTVENENARDWYFSSEETPAYAHSFLLTGILSSDYTDVTGNGISDDDLGDAVEFKYTKVYGSANPFKWRTPNSVNKATHNQNLKTILEDDKGSYIYGEKEMWYMHMIESKTMVATFKLENREDLYSVDEQGNKILSQPARRLKEINLYSKADFMNNQTDATPIKTVHFAYSYSLCIGANGNEHGKLTLDSIYFSYNGNVKKPENPYVFNYRNNKAYQQKSYDRWGNFKEKEENPGNQQSGYLHNDDFPYVAQDSLKAAANASAWALDSIVLPSGGAIKVDYESDDYAYVQNKRAMQMFTIAGFGNTTTANDLSNKLYSGNNDNLYVYIDLPKPVNSESAFFERYIKDIKKLYFKLRVKVPGNDGGGYEFVSGYCELENENYFGLITNSRAWLKMKGISADGTESGNRSPMSKTAFQFLRLNLPSQAYPGSEVGDQLSPLTVVKLMVGLSENIIQSIRSFDNYAKAKPWMQQVDVDRSFVRLHNPDFKRMGGGHRVKRITIYDHWEKMTGNRGAVYGQEYDYTTHTEINGVKTLISSGVASYEPGLGGDENPFHLPIEYLDKAAILGPTNMMYSEEPMGES